MWDYGDHAVLRFIRNRPADVILPVTVVADADEYTALYVPAGAVYKGQATREGRRLDRSLPFLERERLVGGLADTTWTDTNVLMVQRPASLASISLFWDAGTGEFRNWYVNFQAPLARTRVGFDTADYLLDLVVQPDLSYAWKDQDEFREAREHGLISSGILNAVETAAHRAEQDVLTRSWPYDAGFEGWRPEPGWALPTLGLDWAEELSWPDAG